MKTWGTFQTVFGVANVVQRELGEKGGCRSGLLKWLGVDCPPSFFGGRQNLQPSTVKSGRRGFLFYETVD